MAFTTIVLRLFHNEQGTNKWFKVGEFASLVLRNTKIDSIMPTSESSRVRIINESSKVYKKQGKLSAEEGRDLLRHVDKDEREEMVKYKNEDWFDIIQELSKKSYACLKFNLKPVEQRVFPDAEVDFFYEQLKETFPDYYSAFEAMGMPEKDIENPDDDSSKFRPAYLKAQQITDMKIEAQNIKSAKAGHVPAVNTYMRLREKQKRDTYDTDPEDDFNSSIYQSEPEKDAPKKRTVKETAIKIEKPSDNPNWDPEEIEEES